jgi:hypothetical protein
MKLSGTNALVSLLVLVAVVVVVRAARREGF